MKRFLLLGGAAGVVLVGAGIPTPLQPDGTTIISNNAVISCATATTSQLGCVKPDGSTITINGSGVISSSWGGSGTITGVTAGSGLTGGGTSGNVTVAVKPDNSVAVLSSGRLSASGLTNVLELACGITINDGATHTVSTAPSGSCFYGLTTLAQVAAISINGTTPFYFLTDSGTITGPMGTPGSTTNPFTSSGGAYKLTNSSVANLDIAWLAIQAALLAGGAYVPAGTYKIGSSETLPLMIPLSFENGGNVEGVPVRLAGDGPRLSNILAGSDFGAGNLLISCGDPSATTSNSLGRFNGGNSMCFGSAQGLLFEGTTSGWYWTIGATTINMDGFAPGARFRTQDIESNGFNHDWLISGDHTSHFRAHATGGAYGFHWENPNPALYGDLMFYDMQSSGQSLASISVASGASIEADFEGQTYLSGPFAIEFLSGSCTAGISDAHFGNLKAEYIGYAVITDDTGYSSGTYTDANKCRSVNKLTIEDTFWSFSNAKYGITGRQRRAAFDVGDWSGRMLDLQTDTGLQSPNSVAPPSGPSYAVATFNLRSAEDATIGLKISGNINNLIAQSGTLPLVPNGLGVDEFISLEQPGVWSGGLAQLYSAGNYSATSAGDLLEAYGFQGATPAGANLAGGNQPVLGVAMQGGLTPGGYQTGNWVPFASSGYVNVNVGWAGYNFGAYTKATGIGRTITLTAGSGYTSGGPYTWTATGGGCTTEPTGTVTVTSGALAAYTITTQGAGCTSAPSIAIPAGAGSGTGGAITPQWPSALGLLTSTLTPPIIGPAVGGGGSSSSGTEYMTIRLQGLQ